MHDKINDDSKGHPRIEQKETKTQNENKRNDKTMHKQNQNKKRDVI